MAVVETRGLTAAIGPWPGWIFVVSSVALNMSSTWRLWFPIRLSIDRYSLIRRLHLNQTSYIGFHYSASRHHQAYIFIIKYFNICFMRICMQSNNMKMLNGHVYSIGLLKRIHTQFNLHFYEFYANFYEF
jgi:hypothetical protein